MAAAIGSGVALAGSAGEAAEDQGGVVAPETQVVGEGVLGLELPRRVGHVVEVAVGVGRGVVDGRRQHAVAQGEQRGDRLDAAGRAQGVPGHALGARHRQLARVLAEHLLDHRGLAGVVVLGRGAVRVDVAERVGRDAGVAQRHAHARRAARAGGVGGGLVVGVAGAAVADHLAVDDRAARLGVLRAPRAPGCRRPRR